MALRDTAKNRVKGTAPAGPKKPTVKKTGSLRKSAQSRMGPYGQEEAEMATGGKATDLPVQAPISGATKSQTTMPDFPYLKSFARIPALRRQGAEE